MNTKIFIFTSMFAMLAIYRLEARIVAQITNASTLNSKDGSIVLSVQGGIAPYSYHWDKSPENSNEIFNLAAGDYYVTVTDILGCCTMEDCFTVGSDCPFLVDGINYTNVSVGNGTLSAVLEDDGTPPYEFLWSNGATTQSLSGLNAGKYSVMVTDVLIKMPYMQFDKWLIDQTQKQVIDENMDQIAMVIRERLKNNEGVSSQTIIDFIGKTNLSYSTKVLAIDLILPYSIRDPYLTTSLYDLKSIYLEHDINRPDSIRWGVDSVRFGNAIKMDSVLELESVRLLKIKYRNDLFMGDFYYSVKDTLNAIKYYSKVIEFRFFIQGYKNPTRAYFEELYISASIGLIKAFAGNYPKLKQLTFIPSTYPRILPTYQSYIEASGGRCPICEEISRENMPNLKSIPSIIDKN